MSLVMAFATEDFAIMSGDLRRTHIKSDAVFFDDTPKVFRVNKRVLVGFSGDCYATKQVMKGLTEIGSDSSVQAVARLIRKHIPENAYLFVQLAGFGDGGKMVLAEMSHDTNWRIVKTDIPSGEIRWLHSVAHVNPKPIIEEHYGQLQDVDAEIIANMAREVNEKISETDARVSRECDVLGLVK